MFNARLNLSTSANATSSRKILRNLLNGKQIVAVGGAYDPLSARVIENAGFAAIWAGSYSLSAASLCSPDIDLLTLSETCHIVYRMVAATSLPIIVDCSAGFGSIENVIRVTQDLELVGAAGLAIEDNPFPKRSSLYPNIKRSLISIEEMVMRIQAANTSRYDQDFIILARLESFIAGEPLTTALARAHAYVEAGADGIIVHGRELEQVANFAANWKQDIPLIAIPTLYPEATMATLENSGFRVVIFPNQALRAAIQGMEYALQAILTSGYGAAANEFIVSTTRVDELVGFHALHLNLEAKPISDNTVPPLPVQECDREL